MKKKLMLVVVLLTLGVSANVKAEELNSSEAPTNQMEQVETQRNLKWERDPYQQKVIDDNGNEVPVTINGNDLTITLPKGWSVSFEKNNSSDKNYNPLKINQKELNKYKDVSDEQNNSSDVPRIAPQPNTSPRVVVKQGEKQDSQPQLLFIYNDNKGEGGLPVTITIESPKEGEELTLLYRADDGFYGGSTKLRDSGTLKKEKAKKEQKLVEQKQIEEERKHVEKKLLEDAVLKQMREEDHKTWYQRWGDSIQDQWWNFKGWLRG
ncbi:hypothetical protein SCR05_09680 [Streptococcus canis]|uniref:hypothetical protein n=1 Tax=Streptococcus canis TaxID=1329 RepID=UPI00298D6C2F|nr:hypothetical protein [Streptococcus canis]MDW7797809.1 hypothetical protein [Streptococcus canis]